MPRPLRTLPSVLVVLAALGLVAFASENADTDADTDPLRHLKYRLIGPAAGGRISRVAGVAGDPLTYYAATASGGVWKSVNGGLEWKPIFDDQPISSIGSIAVAPSDPSVVYVGSGEANIRGNVAAGNGIYKSTDGGKTWAHVWKQEGQIGTMIIHPQDPGIAFAAVLGSAFGPNPERGVYRTTDGGTTWKKVLYKDDDTGASDVCFNPASPRVLFAGFWQTRRTPWDLTSGGPGSGLHVSRDGGDTWKELRGKGLPEGIWGKVGVRVAPSDPRRVYALIEAEEGGLFRSDDGGDTWRRISSSRGVQQRAWYYSTLTIDPTDANVIWFPQVPMLKTIDGGESVRSVRAGGWDYHDVWIDPEDNKRLIVGSDAGVSLSRDGGETWVRPPIPISQLYHVSTDTRRPYRVLGTVQDLGTVSGPSNSLRNGGILLSDWHSVGGGEAGHIRADPVDPNIVYAGEYLGFISRYDERTGQAPHVGIYPDNGSGHGAEDMRYRFQWTAPILFSPHDPNVVYHAANVLFRTRDGGQHWEAISPDLTRNDKSKQKWSGGPITGDNTGVEYYCTIFALAESPLKAGVLWAGSDDGLVHLSRDGGETWFDVTPSRLPEWGTVATIEASRWHPGTAYVVADAHRLDDERPYLWKTTNYGKTWRGLTAGLPKDVYLHVVREDTERRGMLYLGTERGVAYSLDDGATWRDLKLNLPTVAVHDLVVEGDDLVVGTMGRSIWILDDLSPLRDMTDEIAEAPAHLFAPGPAVRWRYAARLAGGSPGTRWTSTVTAGAAANPPQGAVIHYYLKEKPSEETYLEIFNANGDLVRRLSSEPEPPIVQPDDPDWRPGTEPPKGALPIEAGINRATWDLAHEGARLIPKAKIDGGSPREGPLARPGDYTLRLNVGGRTYTQLLRVEADPRATASASDIEASVTFALEVRDRLTEIVEMVETIRRLRGQLESANELMRSDPDKSKLVELGGSVIARLTAIEEEIHNPRAQVAYDVLAQQGGAKLYSRMASWLYDVIKEHDGPPTQGTREVADETAIALSEQQKALQDLVSGEIARLNALAAAKGVPFIIMKVEKSEAGK
jgi:photosystem II stability/assembly factor-like uncharacterized protein